MILNLRLDLLGLVCFFIGMLVMVIFYDIDSRMKK